MNQLLGRFKPPRLRRVPSNTQGTSVVKSATVKHSLFGVRGSCRKAASSTRRVQVHTDMI